jgi:hypothetical protein
MTPGWGVPSGWGVSVLDSFSASWSGLLSVEEAGDCFESSTVGVAVSLGGKMSRSLSPLTLRVTTSVLPLDFRRPSACLVDGAIVNDDDDDDDDKASSSGFEKK